jgi:hypothetical protein
MFLALLEADPVAQAAIAAGADPDMGPFELLDHYAAELADFDIDEWAVNGSTEQSQ